MTQPTVTDQHILVAGVGNIFLGDDGFGTEVARRLLLTRMPEGVQVVDIGIRGLDLAFMLLDEYDALVLIDTIARGGPPGTLYLIEADTPIAADVSDEQSDAASRRAVETHSVDPVSVLAFACSLGARPVRTFIVGCEPESLGGDGEDDMYIGLSAPVQASVQEAVLMVERLIAELRGPPIATHRNPQPAGDGSRRAAAQRGEMPHTRPVHMKSEV